MEWLVCFTVEMWVFWWRGAWLFFGTGGDVWKWRGGGVFLEGDDDGRCWRLCTCLEEEMEGRNNEEEVMKRNWESCE